MVHLNSLQYSKMQNLTLLETYSLSTLSANNAFETLCFEFKERFGYKKIKTFSFSKEGFLGLFLELKGTIAVSKGECEAVLQGAKFYEELGFTVLWLPLKKDGRVDLVSIKDENVDFLFLSSYVMDTFVKTNLSQLKDFTSAKIISNASAHRDSNSDVIYFDNYKLTGFNTSGVLLFNDATFALLPVGTMDSIAIKLCMDALKLQHFNYELKNKFLEKLTYLFEDDIYFFVPPELTLDYALHFGLKGIRARELIQTLALSKIFITNGEGCSLGLSRPSKIIQEMGYSEDESKQAISLSFSDEIHDDEIQNVVEEMRKKYQQIKLLNDN